MSVLVSAKRTTLDESACWQAVTARDASLDGCFFFGVLTTGVFCKPSCAARRPLRRNVRFYASPAEAERDGLRPCRRCKPLEQGGMAAKIDALCAFIRERSDSGEALTMDVLARQAGLSPSHLARSFRALVGMTPRRYVEACRVEALKKALRSGESVTRAIFDAGFGSSSRVYEKSGAVLGMTPRQFRSGGEAVTVRYAVVESPLGELMVAATERGLCLVEFGRSRAELEERLAAEMPRATRIAATAPLPQPLAGWVESVLAYLEGRSHELALPVEVDASAFQLAVWTYLRSIPFGERRSYGEVAAAIGRPGSARAVARACASNRAGLVIPCHRVVRGDGELGGYRWGVERKERLLAAERASSRR